jgi:hypothetical protein
MEEIVKMNVRSALTAAAVSLICLCAAACGHGVSGHTYAGPGGLVQIEFQSDGKAVATLGGLTSNCTYSQSGDIVSLVCEGDKEALTVANDGSLNGPPDGMLAHLTKTK